MDALTLRTTTGAPVTTVARTFTLFALFLPLTAHITTRNIPGDVRLKKVSVVGLVPAATAVVFTSFGWSSFVALAPALGLDFDFIKYLYGRSTHLSAYVIITHFVVPVLLGLILFGLSAILLTAPF